MTRWLNFLAEIASVCPVCSAACVLCLSVEEDVLGGWSLVLFEREESPGFIERDGR